MPSKPSILVVDDALDGREMLVEYLTFRGFHVAEARHGQEAIDVTRSMRPDIVLMDLAMPGIDGFEATRRLKADPLTKDAIIIALTAHAFPNERNLAFEAGIDGFVVKPFELASLADALVRVKSKGVGALHAPTLAVSRRDPSTPSTG